MFKSRLKYVIKGCSSDNPQALETLLNEMSEKGWDLYSMHEVESDNGFMFHCIFMTEAQANDDETYDENLVNIKTFKSQMEKMLSSQSTPFETCREIQAKIKEQKNTISKIKKQLEEEATASTSRKKLNDEMSKALKLLENFKEQLVKEISPELMYSEIGEEKLSISMSEEIIGFVSPDEQDNLITQTVKTREKLTRELGYILPKILFKDDDTFAPYEFAIRIRGLDVIKDFAYPERLAFFIDELKLTKKIKDAIYTTDLVTGKNMVWLPQEKVKDFWAKGFTPSEFISRILEFAAVKYVEDLFDYEDTNRYIDIVTEKNSFLVDNIMPDFLSVAELKYLLCNLIRERVSIKDIVYIFEKMNDFSDDPDKENLFDKLRLALAPHICKRLVDADGVIYAFDVTDKTVDNFFSKVKEGQQIIRIDGTKLEKLAAKIIKKSKAAGLSAPVLCAPYEVRHMMFTVLSQMLNNFTVICREEVGSNAILEIVDEI